MQYPKPGTSEPIWRVLDPLGPGSGLPSAQRLLLSDIPERWTQILLRVKDEDRELGRFARVLPESLPLTAQWIPDYPLAPIDLKALREAHAPDVSVGGFMFTLEPWGSSVSYGILFFEFGPDTEEWPVWNLRVPEGISYQLWLQDRRWDRDPELAPGDHYRKLPTPRLR